MFSRENFCGNRSVWLWCYPAPDINLKFFFLIEYLCVRLFNFQFSDIYTHPLPTEPTSKLEIRAATMRPLTEEETKILFEKLAQYIGRNIGNLINRSDEPYCFRIQKDRVYYVSEAVAKFSTCVGRKQLISLGTCVGKFTKTGKFRIHITALDVLAPNAKYKIAIKQNGEMPFLYGNNVLNAHIDNMTQDTPGHAGLIITDKHGRPLGFGVSAKSSMERKNAPPNAIMSFRQGDVGEYLREEDTLFA